MEARNFEGEVQDCDESRRSHSVNAEEEVMRCAIRQCPEELLAHSDIGPMDYCSTTVSPMHIGSCDNTKLWEKMDSSAQVQADQGSHHLDFVVGAKVHRTEAIQESAQRVHFAAINRARSQSSLRLRSTRSVTYHNPKLRSKVPGSSKVPP